jgi:RNA polymerase sigma-70 factor (ECF subfamily)
MRQETRNVDETPATDNLSPEEVRERISQLREPDILKLLELAHARLYKSGALAPMEELLSESVSRILSGRRNWRRDMDTVPFIFGVMKSISDEFLKRREASLVIPESDIPGADPSGEGLLERSTRDDPKLSVQERAISAQEKLRRVEELFNDDELAQQVVLGRAEGWSPEEIQKEFNMTKTEYASASKKIRRRFLKEGLTGPQS